MRILQQVHIISFAKFCFDLLLTRLKKLSSYKKTSKTDRTVKTETKPIQFRHFYPIWQFQKIQLILYFFSSPSGTPYEGSLHAGFRNRKKYWKKHDTWWSFYALNRTFNSSFYRNQLCAEAEDCTWIFSSKTPLKVGIILHHHWNYHHVAPTTASWFRAAQLRMMVPVAAAATEAP